MRSVESGYPCPSCSFVGQTKGETETHIRVHHFPDRPRRVGWATTALATLAVLLVPGQVLAQDDPNAAAYKLFATPVQSVQSDIVSFHGYEDVNGNGTYDAGGSEDPSWWAPGIDYQVYSGRALVYSAQAHPDGTTEAIALLPGAFTVQMGYDGIVSGCATGVAGWVATGGAEYTIFINMHACPVQ